MHQDGKLAGIDVIANPRANSLVFIDCDVVRSEGNYAFSIHPEKSPVIIPSSSEPIQNYIINNTPTTFIVRTHAQVIDGRRVHHEGTVEVIGMSGGQSIMLRYRIATREDVEPDAVTPVQAELPTNAPDAPH
jgi:hypothetical protein